MNESKSRPRKILAKAKTGALVCIGIAETACNLPLHEPGTGGVTDTGGSGGQIEIELPDQTGTGGSGGNVQIGAAGSDALGGAGGEQADGL